VTFTCVQKHAKEKLLIVVSKVGIYIFIIKCYFFFTKYFFF